MVAPPRWTCATDGSRSPAPHRRRIAPAGDAGCTASGIPRRQGSGTEGAYQIGARREQRSATWRNRWVCCYERWEQVREKGGVFMPMHIVYRKCTETTRNFVSQGDMDT